MKELSIEEKAKAYDEIIGKAKKELNACGSQARKDVALSIINYLDNNSVGMCLSNMECEDNEDACVNSKWTKLYNYMKKKLEKQGEQNLVEFKPLFRVGDVIKPKDPVLGEPRIIKGVHPKFGYDTNNGILDFEFEDNWELVEQKPTWSEEDSPYYDDICEMLINLLHSETADVNKGAVQKDLDWLISLRPQSTWKPSDEQMITLRHVISGCSYDIEPLVELETKLKEL